MTQSYLELLLEETPRYDGAPTTTPYRLSQTPFFYPVRSGRIAPSPQMMDRSDELRGNLSPTSQIVEMYQPSGAIGIRAYVNSIIPLLHLAGLVGTVTPGNGANEVQTVSVTGAPTGGTFTLTYGSVTSEAIPHNASAKRVRSALERMSSIGAGNVVCAGGPFPTTPVTVTFVGALAATNVALMTKASSLTGGTSPTVTVVETTPGSAGTVLTPDGKGVSAGAHVWTFAKRPGATAKSAQVRIAYTESGTFEIGQGFGVSQMTLSAAGEFSADLMGLVERGTSDPGLTPSYDTLAVHPLMARNLVVTWREGAGNVTDFSMRLANPIEAVPHRGIRSPYPGLLEQADIVRLTGSASFHAFDPDDRDSLLSAETFAALSHWRSQTTIGSSGYPYSLFCDMPAAQLVGGQGPDELSNRRRFGATYDWAAAYDEAAGHDFEITAVGAVAAVETYT